MAATLKDIMNMMNVKLARESAKYRDPLAHLSEKERKRRHKRSLKLLKKYRFPT